MYRIKESGIIILTCLDDIIMRNQVIESTGPIFLNPKRKAMSMVTDVSMVKVVDERNLLLSNKRDGAEMPKKQCPCNQNVGGGDLG